jgi:hypothetical protein
MITRDESGKEIKEVEKILPKHSSDILVIVDDLAAVWGPFYTHVVGIVPFYFFKDANILKYEQARKEKCEDFEPTAVKSVEVLVDEKPIVTVEVHDCFLKFLPAFLQRLHSLYFNAGRPSIPKVQ